MKRTVTQREVPVKTGNAQALSQTAGANTESVLK